MSRQNKIYKVTLIGSAANIALLILKFIAAIIANSSAMMADALHSLSDLLTDIVVLLFIHLSAKPQDHTHNYGHGKFETFATFIIGLLLAAAAITIAATATHKVILSANGTHRNTPLHLAQERATTIEQKLKQRFGQSTHVSIHMEPIK